MIELNGRRLGLDDELARDYGAFHDAAAAIDLSDRGRMRFTGAGARNALNGILTCDVAPLADGQGTYGAALTAKGKVVADVAVFANEDSFLVESSVPAWPGWQQLVAKYINPRLAPRINETDTTGSLGVFGPEAARIAGAVGGVDREALESLPIYSHLNSARHGASVNIARLPDMGVDGYRLLVARSGLEALRAAATSEGARLVGPAAVESARVEAGRPLWGIDMDESTLPQEVNLEALGAVSFTKGCYTGQEVVARLHFRGHVNRRLMGLRVEGATAPERGAELTNLEGAVCGDVRSSVVSPRFGPIALGMVRREVDAGAQIKTRIAGISVSAEVTALPFGG
jgi:folate-binding protein YgfZ